MTDEDYIYLTKLNRKQEMFLKHVAYLYIWWQTAEEALDMPFLLVAKIMDKGHIKNIQELLDLFSKEYLIKILKNASIGQFSPSSWCFWHINLLDMDYYNIPNMPKRFDN